jgi:hypothetical protein
MSFHHLLAANGGNSRRTTSPLPSTAVPARYGTDPDYELPRTRSLSEAALRGEGLDWAVGSSRRRGPFSRIFSRGNDLEGAHTAHHYTATEKKQLQSFESIDYLPPSSRAYRAWLSMQPWNRHWDRWLLMAAIGITIGVVGFCLHFLVHILAFIKYHGTRWLLAHTHITLGWAFNMLYSLGLVYASTWLVVNIAPQAAGAGVAEVMAYLNGCHMSGLMSLKTLGVKFLSAATAVGSGLPVGPEGPMIHIGAIIAAGLSQGASATLGWDPGFFRRFRNPKDKRDFVTAGAAVGVATAFSAPVGGLLFMFEEVASFWQQSLGWQIFFACMLAVLTADTLRSGVAALREGTFGECDYLLFVILCQGNKTKTWKTPPYLFYILVFTKHFDSPPSSTLTQVFSTRTRPPYSSRSTPN